MSSSAQYRMVRRDTVRRLPPDGASYPWFASRLRKTNSMTAAPSVVNTMTFSNTMRGYHGERTVAHFERQLAMHKAEEARLRCALARAEALLDERRPATPRREE